MKQYVLEWSKKQNAFHIQPVEISLSRNQECFLRNGISDYIVLMIGTFDVVTNMADHHREKLIEREIPMNMAELIANAI